MYDPKIQEQILTDFFEFPVPPKEEWSFQPERAHTWDPYPSEECAMDNFFKKQQKLPPALRGPCMLVCRCSKCARRVTL